MATIEERLLALERSLKQVQGVASAIQGDPASATISIPHNDSWLFEDNVDGAGGFPGNLRYIISTNVQRVVSARLSIHLAAYRTYNSLSFSATGAGSAHHHAYTASVTPSNVALTHTLRNDNTGSWALDDGSSRIVATMPFDTNDTVNESTHTHTVSGSSVLGVTEGAVATGVSLSFDGVDHTAALGGPFSSDVIELDVLRFLATTKNAFHVIAMQTTALGRLEAHLRLGVYVSAGSVF